MTTPLVRSVLDGPEFAKRAEQIRKSCRAVAHAITILRAKVTDELPDGARANLWLSLAYRSLEDCYLRLGKANEAAQATDTRAEGEPSEEDDDDTP